MMKPLQSIYNVRRLFKMTRLLYCREYKKVKEHINEIMFLIIILIG